MSIRVLSSTPGRQRLDVAAVKSRPRLAAAVEARIRKHPQVVLVRANHLTGRVLVMWTADTLAPDFESVIRKAIEDGPLSPEACLRRQDNRDTKVQRLRFKLLIGGFNLVVILLQRTFFSPLAGPFGSALLSLSVVTIGVTGYSFFRSLIRTSTGHARVTTGTLIGTALAASVYLHEFSTALIVIWLLNLGELLELVVLRRTRVAIRGLLTDDETEVWILKGDVEIAIPLAEVQVGQLALALPGRRIPVDGVIQSGTGTINEAPITGESVPAVRHPGDKVHAGTVLLAGTLVLHITAVRSDTLVGRLIDRVERAQALRPEIQRVGDRFARLVVPAAFISSALVFFLTGDPTRSLTMLLVACPCAAGLATPTAVSASIGNGARRGILVKGGTHLEALARVDTMGFDKTGTLTAGELSVTRIVSGDPQYSEDQVLDLVAQAEAHSQHPFAVAILSKAGLESGQTAPRGEVEILPGRGILSRWDDHEVLVGSRRLLEDYGIEIPSETEISFASGQRPMESIIYAAHQGRFLGMIGISAEIRPGAVEALSRLRKAGIVRLVMLTGDVPRVAEEVATSVGITEWSARMMPQDKLDSVEAIRTAGGRVAMVGDGINDAPALAVADVGIALGTAGSDVALETADVALASGDLRQIADVVQISRRTIRVIRQNYGMALGVNGFGVLLGATGTLNPLMAAFLHNMSTVIVTINSSRLINFRPNSSQDSSF